jgi:hypothetical protein
MESMRQQSLISLLTRFRVKQCHDTRDRIFSLLSLSSNEGRGLKIDYNITRFDLALQVLLECKQSLCFCSAVVVVQTLGLDINDHDPRRTQWYLEFDVIRDFVNYETALQYRYLHSYHRSQPPDGENYPGYGYSFQDTCESTSLYGFLIA